MTDLRKAAEGAREALDRIACNHQILDLLWWQIEARAARDALDAALSAPAPAPKNPDCITQLIAEHRALYERWKRDFVARV